MNESLETHLRPMLPPGGKNWPLISPHWVKGKKERTSSAGNTEGRSITLLLTSCLTGLESAVWQLTIFVLLAKQANQNQSNRRSTVLHSELPPYSIPCLVGSPFITNSLTREPIGVKHFQSCGACAHCNSGSWGRIFSYGRPSNEWAVSDLGLCTYLYGSRSLTAHS